MWFFITVMSVVSFAALAVQVRRRFDTEELVAACAVGSVVMGVLIVAAGWKQEDFLHGPPIGAMIAGIIATAFTVDKLAERSATPNPVPETAAGVAGFFAGAIVGFYVGFLFSLRGLAWVG